jgi:hypothetical protein
LGKYTNSKARTFLMFFFGLLMVAVTFWWPSRYMEGSVDRDAGASLRDGIKCMEKLGVCPEAVWKSLGFMWIHGMGWYECGWMAGYFVV